MNIFESIMSIIYVPLAFILKLCYMLVGNYGVAIILFSIVAKLLLLPLGIKGEKGRLRQQKMQPKISALQAKYKGNTRDPKYSEELQKIYNEEGFNPMSGCLPQLIQFPIILGLWNAIRQPLSYVLSWSTDLIYRIVTVFNDAGVESITKALGNVNISDAGAMKTWISQNQILVAQTINQGDNLSLIESLLPENYSLLKMDFLGLNLGSTPADFGFWSWMLLMPVIAGITSFLVGFISQRVNRVPGAEQQKMPASLNAMMYIMPLVSVWMSYKFQIGIGIYWITSNILSIGQIFLLKALVRPPKEAAKPAREKKLNYNQIEKMKREAADAPEGEIIVIEDGDAQAEPEEKQ